MQALWTVALWMLLKALIEPAVKAPFEVWVKPRLERWLKSFGPYRGLGTRRAAKG